jgi:hypothetical protein
MNDFFIADTLCRPKMLTSELTDGMEPPKIVSNRGRSVGLGLRCPAATTGPSGRARMAQPQLVNAVVIAVG